MKIQTTCSFLRVFFLYPWASQDDYYLRPRQLEPKAILWNSRWVAVDPSKALIVNGQFIQNRNRTTGCFFSIQKTWCLYNGFYRYVCCTSQKIRFSQSKKNCPYLKLPRYLSQTLKGSHACNRNLFPVVVAELRIKLQLGQPVQTALVHC